MVAEGWEAEKAHETLMAQYKSRRTGQGHPDMAPGGGRAPAEDPAMMEAPELSDAEKAEILFNVTSKDIQKVRGSWFVVRGSWLVVSG